MMFLLRQKNPESREDGRRYGQDTTKYLNLSELYNFLRELSTDLRGIL